MKTTAILLILLSAFLLDQSLKAQAPHYEITGNIEGAEGVKFVLQKRFDYKIIYSDTAEVNNRHITFTGSVENPEIFELFALMKRPYRTVLTDKPLSEYIEMRGKRIQFFVENTVIIITANFDSLQNARISGSKINDEYAPFDKSMRQISDRMDKFMKGSSGETRDSVIKAADDARVARKDLVTEFIRQNPKSFASLYIVESSLYSGIQMEETERLLNSLDPEVVNSPGGIKLKDLIEEKKKDYSERQKKGLEQKKAADLKRKTFVENKQLWIEEINEKSSSGGKDHIMKFEEIERLDNYSITRFTYTSGPSVASAMFPLMGCYNISKIRGNKYFILLKGWKDEEGRFMNKVGFCDSNDIDLKKVFGDDIKEGLRTKDFMSVMNYDQIFP